MTKPTDNIKQVPPETQARFSRKIVGVSVFLIGYFTLFPFDFFFKKAPSLVEIFRNFDLTLTQSYALADFPRNVLLFVPLGFGLAGLLFARNGHRAGSYLWILLIGTGLSLMVEVLQAYALLRFPSFADVLANGLGTAVGILIFHFYGSSILAGIGRLADQAKAFFTFRRALITYILYVFLWLSISYLMKNQVQLSNWDDQYPLLLGNELTQDRPWQGVIQQLHIGDRALTVEEVIRLFKGDSTVNLGQIVASYDFTGDDTNNFPTLHWKGDGPPHTGGRGVILSEEQWLQSDQPAAAISQALENSSQFSMELRAASNDLTQTGPARIVSISEDPYLRNLTVGQQETDLVLRLRNPLAGLSGGQPELILPNVFIDHAFHRIVITYDGVIVRFYIDDPANVFTIELIPSIAFFTKFFPNDVEQMRINYGNMFIFRLLFSALIFVPLSLLALIWSQSESTASKKKLVWLGAGLLFPAGLWELLLNVVLSGYDLRAGNIVLNLGVTAVSFLLMRQSKKIPAGTTII